MSTAASFGASAQAIRSHYDVGNEFYRLWLDATMTYSCGLWLSPSDDLEQSQVNKMDWHLSNAGVRAGTRLLDVGCGWGGMMFRAVNQYSVTQATGLTLSEAQAQAINQAAVPNVQVRCASWAAHQPAQPYDAIVSVGAFEHFARLDQEPQSKLEGYRGFFQFCRDALVPGGRLALQTILYETADRRDFSRFFATQIFPESDLPHLDEIVRAARGLFEIETLRNDRRHYERTLREWRARLRNSRAAAVRQVGEDVVARYDQYFNLLIIGFHQATMNLGRMILRRL
jgi:cyclopropane-fatty-acyl-phospholipid synthase